MKTLNLKVSIAGIPAVRAGGAARGRGKYFDIKTDSPYMLMVAPVNVDQRRAMTLEEALFGIDKLNVPRSGIPAVTHIDILNAHPDRAQGNQSASTTCSKPQGQDRQFGRGEHLVQRARRGRSCTPEDAWRCLWARSSRGDRQLNYSEGRSGSRAEARLQERLQGLDPARRRLDRLERSVGPQDRRTAKFPDAGPAEIVIKVGAAAVNFPVS